MGYKVGETKTKDGKLVKIIEIDGDRIHGKVDWGIGEGWMACTWLSDGTPHWDVDDTDNAIAENDTPLILEFDMIKPEQYLVDQWDMGTRSIAIRLGSYDSNFSKLLGKMWNVRFKEIK